MQNKSNSFSTFNNAKLRPLILFKCSLERAEQLNFVLNNSKQKLYLKNIHQRKEKGRRVGCGRVLRDTKFN